MANTQNVTSALYTRTAISDIADTILLSEDAARDPEAQIAIADWNAQSRANLTYEEAWPVLRLAYKYGFFELLNSQGLPSVPFDLKLDVRDVRTLEFLKPMGMTLAPPAIPLRTKPTKIAGFTVDFPLALPASIIAAHSTWLKYFADRGFCVLTYKTLRNRETEAHPAPNWAFVKDTEITTDDTSKVIAEKDYWPSDPTTASMVNSFGIPSFDPDWWQDDLRKAREFVEEGHQVLIASIVASISEPFDDVVSDFAAAAVLASNAGADIIELNLSCPNTTGEASGLLYAQPQNSAKVASAVKEALASTNTPIFVKVGYLETEALTKFTDAVTPFVDGIVGINTMPATVVDSSGRPFFLDSAEQGDRSSAGVSGWAIKHYAEKFTKDLVKLRKSIVDSSRKDFSIVSVGGVMSAHDFDERLELGSDAVGICTGAFVNPHIGLDIRSKLESKHAKMDLEVKDNFDARTGHDDAQVSGVHHVLERTSNMMEFPSNLSRDIEHFSGKVVRKEKLGYGYVKFDNWPSDQPDWGFFSSNSPDTVIGRIPSVGTQVKGKAIRFGEGFRILEISR